MPPLTLFAVAEITGDKAKLLLFSVDDDTFDVMKPDHEQSLHIIDEVRVRVLWFMVGEKTNPDILFEFTEGVIEDDLHDLASRERINLHEFAHLMNRFTRPREAAVSLN